MCRQSTVAMPRVPLRMRSSTTHCGMKRIWPSGVSRVSGVSGVSGVEWLEWSERGGGVARCGGAACTLVAVGIVRSVRGQRRSLSLL